MLSQEDKELLGLFIKDSKKIDKARILTLFIEVTAMYVLTEIMNVIIPVIKNGTISLTGLVKLIPSLIDWLLLKSLFIDKYQQKFTCDYHYLFLVFLAISLLAGKGLQTNSGKRNKLRYSLHCMELSIKDNLSKREKRQLQEYWKERDKHIKEMQEIKQMSS